jgi:Serine/threonine protein kinase
LASQRGATGEFQSTTATLGGTLEGTILGTVAYMSPEQARAQTVDKRTDIWAFACVLYEMLTGQMAFPGETVSDTIVAILEHEPDFAALPPATPPMIARLLRRGLEKDPRRRLRDIADARADLDDALEGGTAAAMGGSAPVVSTYSRWRWWAAIVLVSLASALVGWTLRRLNPAPDNPLNNATFTRLTSLEGDEAEAALSPDGKFAAFLSLPRRTRSMCG